MSFISRLFSLPFWAQVLQTILHTCQRFPLAVLSLLALNFVFLTKIHNAYFLTDDQQQDIFLISLGGIFWFIASTLLAENLRWNKLKQYLFSLPIFVAYSWYSIEHVIALESAVLILAAGLFISFAPYVARRSDNASVWYFNYQVIAAAFFAILSGVILSSGVSLTLVSLEYLFEFDLHRHAYEDIWLIGMVFLAPLYLLASIPKQFDYPRSDCGFPKGVHFILTYILVPLALVYMVILYAYFIKISIQGILPEGHLGLMISWFGVLGIITHLAIYPIHDRSSALLNWFYRHFYIMLIVPLGLLILAISTRILQYGFTEQRYLIVLCAVWFAVLIISFILNRQHFQLKRVTLSLALLSALVSFGPWGIQQFPINNQFSRLEQLVIEENLLSNGLINVSEQPASNVQKSISSIVDYLIRHHAEDKIRPWIKDKELFDNPQHCHNITTHCSLSGEQLVTLMGINYVSKWQESHSDYVGISRQNVFEETRIIATSGYDVLIPISWNGHRTDEEKQNTSPYSIDIDKSAQLTITIADKAPIQFDLLAFSAQFAESGTIVIEPDQAEKLILSQVEAGTSARLYIDDMQIWFTNSEVQSTSLTGYLLLKLD